ncbi:methyltransferase domain-containing protein, partial [Candidatus Magnetaquicoccus inordinatus]|uniref:methyltransferase domain-containing protein n=1 Tax=Candidatus Magnetaquicoccus inordinatus TaxID=2496818 RepID=UPI00187D1FCD
MVQSIMQAFAQAEQYAEHAQVQRLVAERLAARITLPLLAPTMLELGCGTGLFSQQLCQRWPQGRLLCSDLTWPMVQRCRTALATTDKVRYGLWDGQDPPLAKEQFDLIAASMVMQWFVQPGAALHKWHALLRPGGCIAMATLAPGTFHEWRSACAAAGMAHGLRDYPDAASWQASWPHPADATIEEEQIVVHHSSGLAFLRGLRAVGAHVPA